MAITLMGLISVSLTPAFPEASPDAIVGVWPDRVSGSLGSEFTVSVNVTSIVDVFGFDVTMRYDAALLNGTDVKIGAFFSSEPHLEFVPIFSDARSEVQFVATLTGERTGLTGSGILLQVSFRVKGVGYAAFDVLEDRLDMLDSDSQRIFPSSIIDGIFDNRPNNSPAISEIAGLTVEQGAVLTFAVQATDIDGDTLNYSLAQASSGIFPDGATIDTNGVFSWTPGPSQGPGTYSARIVVGDGTDTVYREINITVTAPSRVGSPASVNWLPWIALGLVILSAALLAVKRAWRKK